MKIFLKIMVALFLIGATFIAYEKIVSDDFTNCQRFFLTDKDEYQVGDTILLTAVIIPDNEKKTIKVLRDFSNLEFRVLYQFKSNTPDSTKYNIDWRRDTTKKRYQNSQYDKFIITKQNPYKQTFKGLFSFDTLTKEYKIEFKDYGYSFHFSKNEYNYFETFGFSGIWYPVRPIIGASLEEFIGQKIVKLKL
jgi:hypothetical protein